MADEVKDLQTKEMILDMGPMHPAMHGVIRLILTLDGENVVKCDPEIGYLHRGFEKMCENGSYAQAIPYTDRLNYVSPLINNVGYVMAVEKLFDITVPERCQYIRVLISEISRITDHLTCNGALAMELGAFTVFLYLIEARDFFYDVIEEICGARVTTNYTRIGGLAKDLPEGFEGNLHDAINRMKKLVEDSEKLLHRNRIFYDRTRDIGTITQEEAIAYSFTGPCLRASGVNYDVRKAQPYLVYDQVHFDIPLGERGDTYDRYNVRIQEIYQSVRIIEQVLKYMPKGPVNVDDRRVIRPPKEEVYGNIEGLMDHFKITYEGVSPPPGEAYFAVEGGNGELGFYIVSDGTGRPYKCRCRPPCFLFMQAVPRLVEGQMLADIIPIFGSINMIAGECDR